MITEITFDTDGTGELTIKRDYEAKIHQIINLITMKKNTDPFNPDKGVDINSYRYRLDDEVTKTELQRSIESQVSTYTPYQISDISIKIAMNTILVAIQLLGSDDIIIVANNEYNKTKFDILADKNSTT